MTSPKTLPKPELERLIQIGGAIRAVRNTIISQHYDPRKDRWRWGIACWIFERICNEIYQMSLADGPVEMISPNLHFVFKVDGVPLRFYRGKRHSRAPGAQLNIQVPELHAIQPFLLPADGDYAVAAYRILYETDKDTLLVSRVFLVALNNECAIIEAWEIPNIDSSEAGGIATYHGPVPINIMGGDRLVDLLPVSVELIQEIEEREEQEVAMEESAREAGL